MYSNNVFLWTNSHTAGVRPKQEDKNMMETYMKKVYMCWYMKHWNVISATSKVASKQSEMKGCFFDAMMFVSLMMIKLTNIHLPQRLTKKLEERREQKKKGEEEVSG